VPKVRESGIPPLERWESFFDPTGILDVLGCRNVIGDVLELGCGYGTFTIPAARRVRGTVYALDIDPLMVATTVDRAAKAGLSNIAAQVRDFVVAGSGRPASSISFVMLFNILHFEDPLRLLREAHRVLRPKGTAGVIHWRRDVETPRGPPADIRPRPEQCELWAEQAGFRRVRAKELPGSPWHWGMVLERT
jgi:SAM-dependent methyltransferase